MDISWLEVLAAVIAAAGSLVAIIIPLSEFGAASRARRRATFWKEQLETTPIPQDQAIAQSLYRDAAATVIAFEAYPGRKLATPWLLGVFPPLVAVVAVAYALGKTIGSPDLSYTELIPALALPLILTIGLRQVMATVIRRRLLAKQYLQGKKLDAEDRVDVNGNDVTQGIVETIGQAFGTFVFCLGACLTIGSISFLTGAATTEGGISSFLAAVGPLMVAGFILTGLGSTSLDSILSQGRREWVHPQDLPTAIGESQSESDKAAHALSRAAKQPFTVLMRSWRGHRTKSDI